MARWYPVLVVLAACRADSAQSDTAPGLGALGEPPAGDFLLIDVDELAVRWLPADGWTLAGTYVIGDVTGDGLTDAVTPVVEIGTNVARALLVAGPLRRSLTLPGDEVASFPLAGDPHSGDATGDGIADLYGVATADRIPFVLAGPFSGEMDPLVDGTRLDESARLEDIDGDGILDLATSTIQEMQITWGPISRWSGPADLTVELTCGDVNGFSSVSLVEAYPDLDGDGAREVWLTDPDSVCPSWYFPLPVGPTYAPESDDAAIAGLREMQMVADETGDGLSDVWIWQDRVVHTAPLAFSADLLASEAIQVDLDLYAVYPTAFDLDGDGLAEFVGLDAEVDPSEVQQSIGTPIDPETGEVLVIVPGGAGLGDPDYATAWDIDGREFSSDDVFLEAGVVSVLVSRFGEEVIVVDLGAGTAP